MGSEYVENSKQNSDGNTIRDSINHFSDDTTLHGFRNALHSKYRIIRRIFWTMVLLTMVTAYVYVLANSTRNYLKYETSTKITKKHVSTLRFPSVSICDQNIFPKSALMKYPGLEELLTTHFMGDNLHNLTTGMWKVI